MGTRLDLVVVDVDDKMADNLLSLISNRLDDLVDILSVYKADSELSVLNREAFKSPFIASKELFDNLLRCKELFELTGGYFDISASLSRNVISDSKEVDWSSVIGMDKVNLDSDNLTVELDNEFIKLDPGGYGKGLALEEIKKILLRQGVEKALLSFGESSVLGLGTHPFGEYWPIGISNIFESTQNVKILELVNSGLSTSGSGFVDKDGIFKSFNNIVNPKTGQVLTEPATLTVRCNDMVMAEALSTSLLVNSDCIGALELLPDELEAFKVIYDAEKQFEVNELFK